jgi:hypothetical protein
MVTIKVTMCLVISYVYSSNTDKTGIADKGMLSAGTGMAEVGMAEMGMADTDMAGKPGKVEPFQGSAVLLRPNR